jgi:hypothetical protein
VARRVKEWQRTFARNGQRSLAKLIQKNDEVLLRLVEQAARDSERIIRTLPGTSISGSVRAVQYQQSRAALYDLYTQLWIEDVQSQVLMRAGTSSQMAANETKALLSRLARGATPGRVGILADSIQASARTGFSNVVSRIENNIDLSPNVYRARAFSLGKIDEIVNNGLLLNKSAAEIAKEVSGFVNPSTPGGVRYAAQRLGRTELNNAFHQTSIRTYQDSPFVDSIEWNLSGSHPAPDKCNTYAEENEYGIGRGRFPKDEVPDKPHPQCFCFITPVTPEPDEFLRRMKRGEYDCARSVL